MDSGMHLMATASWTRNIWAAQTGYAVLSEFKYSQSIISVFLLEALNVEIEVETMLSLTTANDEIVVFSS